MNLKELDSFKISDAITFHDKLNPKLFSGSKLRPEVTSQLKLIAQDFLEELGINNLDVVDMTISGSNAAYSYTPHSDLDLHILVDMGNLPNDEVYKELFNAKKNIYNDSHNIKIHGVPVELYVQDAREPVISLGEYSIDKDEWLRLPTKRRANFDQTATKSKYEKLLGLIELGLQSDDIGRVSNILKKIRQYRQAGLDKGGEFGPENLAYKALRSQGLITKLYNLRDRLHDEILTIETMYQDPVRVQRDSLEEKLSKEFEDYDPNGVPPGPESDDETIQNYNKLNKILTKLCEMVVKGQHSTKDYGMVAACVLDPDNKIVAGLNGPGPDGKRVHAERVAIEKYENKYGSVPKGSIVITTLSPCNESDDETAANRVGESCTDYLNSKKIKKVYCGYMDPTQDNDNREFNILETGDKSIREECKKFADTFLKHDINEGFDQPYPVKWEKGEHGDVDALATLNDGTYLSIMFNNQQGTEGEEVVQVEFYRNNSQEVTGEGDAMRIFATVLTAIQQYIKKYKPAKLSFSASKQIDPTVYYEPGQPQPNPESRAKLYDRLVQRYSKAWGYRAFRADNGDLVIYELSRMKSVKENELQYGVEKTSIVSPYAGIKDSQFRGGIAEASGYIPSEKEKNDPRFKTALTVDVKPDSIKKNAKAFNMYTSRAGIPPTAKPNGKF
jgi:pyrimidine deaminase RibD-like protein